MDKEATQKDTKPTTESVKTEASSTKPDFKRNNNPREFKKNRRSSSRRRERPRSEFEQKILDIRRVTRVSSGGRRFTFAVSIAIGDKRGRVGVGTGKAGDTSQAIDKAAKNAKKNLIVVKTTATNSIPHGVTKKYSSARVMLMPAPGRGVIAGSAVKDCLELSGINDVNSKIISGSKNKLNIAKATVQALDSLKTPVGKDAKKVGKDFKKDKTVKSPVKTAVKK